MPEIAEIALMREFINENSKDRVFVAMNDINNSKFSLVKSRIKAHSRGKELMVHLIDVDRKIFFSMGMTGNFVSNKNNHNMHRHTRFQFIDINSGSIDLVDTRKFAKWKERSDWGSNRGHDPIYEFDDFFNALKEAIDSKNKKLNAPIAEVLLNQKFFNGIGNYLRAEILYRAQIDPRRNALEVFEDKKNIEIVAKLCQQCALEAYAIGGGQIKDWVSPFGADKQNFWDWLNVYQKGESYYDANGRRVWWDSKVQH